MNLEMLSKAPPFGGVDPSSIRAFYAAGVPTTDLGAFNQELPIHRPWWAGLFPSLAARATERAVREQFGEIAAAVTLYDGQVESWVKSKVSRLVDLYEAQAGAVREQIRRARAEPTGEDVFNDESAIECDLRELREASIAKAELPLVPSAGTWGL